MLNTTVELKFQILCYNNIIPNVNEDVNIHKKQSSETVGQTNINTRRGSELNKKNLING